MGYCLIWLNADGTKLYSSNTNSCSSFVEDISSCAEIVQQKNAITAAKSLVKYGLYDKMPKGGELYVGEVQRLAVPVQKVEDRVKKEGYVISTTDSNGVEYLFRGPKKSDSYRYYCFDDNGQVPTIFKTVAEAEKTIEKLKEQFYESYIDEQKTIESRFSRGYYSASIKDVSDVINHYKIHYDQACNAKVIYKTHE